MGLQSQLSDVSSENILVLATVLAARSARYLRSLFFAILHGLGLVSFSNPYDSQFDQHIYRLDSSFLDELVGGSDGLSEVVVLCEQLRRNRVFSYQGGGEEDGGDGDDCVVCLNKIENGQKVRQLPCRHVFHSDCLDGWFHRLNFNCPLCRAPSWGSDESYADDRRRSVAVDLLAWVNSTYE